MFTKPALPFWLKLNGKVIAKFENEQLAQSNVDIQCGEAVQGTTIELLEIIAPEGEMQRSIIAFNSEGEQVI